MIGEPVWCTGEWEGKLMPGGGGRTGRGEDDGRERGFCMGRACP